MNKTSPKISIIVPVYNTEAYLKECLESAVQQTLPNIEIICIDDGSTDNSLNILKEYSNKYRNIKVLTQKNQYAGTARNKGLDITKGEYVIFLDSDDWLELEACEELYKTITKNNADIVFFGIYNYDQNTKEKTIDKFRLSWAKDIKNKEKGFHLYEIKKHFIKTGESTNKIYKRELLDKNNIRFSPERMCEDNVVPVKAMAYSDIVAVYDEKPLYNYRRHDASSNSTCAKYWKDIFTAKKLALDSILESPRPQDYLGTYLIYYINSTSYWYKKWSKEDNKIKKEMYIKLKKTYDDLNSKYDFNKYKDDIDDYAFVKKVLKYTWEQYKIINFLQQIFSVKNHSKKHKVITILGIKLKLKRVKKHDRKNK